MAITYHAFRVFDYKGGELVSEINLFRRGLVAELIDYILMAFLEDANYGNIDLDDETAINRFEVEYLNREECFEEVEDFMSDYDNTLIIYKCEDNILKEIYLDRQLWKEMVEEYINE
jgi:hypothetical protein